MLGERNLNGCLSQPGTWPATPACALTGNRTSDLLVLSLALNPHSHTGQGSLPLFISKLTMVSCLRVQNLPAPSTATIQSTRIFVEKVPNSNNWLQIFSQVKWYWFIVEGDVNYALKLFKNNFEEKILKFKELNEPWLAWLSRLGSVLQSKRSLVDSWSGHMPGCRLGAWLRACGRQPIDVCLTFFLPLVPSL